MHVRTTTDTSEEPLFDYDLAPGSEAPAGIEEFQLMDDNELGRGSRRFIMLDECAITRRHHEIHRNFDLRNEQQTPTTTLRFCLKGAVNTRAQGFDGDLHTEAGEHTLWYTPELKTTNRLRRECTYDVVEVYLTSAFLASLAERHPALFDTYLSPIAREEPFSLRGRRVITPRMQRAIHQLLNGREQGPLRRMFIEAKITEILTLQLQQHDSHEVASPGAAILSKKAVDRMHEARGRLLACMTDPPSLPELARQVGTNEFRLKRDFKAVFGSTVYGLLLEYKMEQARAQLLDTDRLVSEIAREIGYAHAAHFSTAFKKTFGLSPSAFRKGA